MPVPTFTAHTLEPAAVPTLYFIGVTTGSSSIQRVFPAWALELGIDARLQGIDLPLHARAEDYRRVVEFIRDDPLSRGALVTTHKIDLYEAAHDLFDERDRFALMMGEVSSVSKRDGELRAHAKDPVSSGLALEALLPEGHFARHPDATVVSMGAGGSTIAISWYLSQPDRGAERPARIVVTNRSQPRLDHLDVTRADFDTTTPFSLVHAPTPADNDAVVAAQPSGSLIINATGLGKDAPGSPLTDAVAFPDSAIVWDLNYRGDLVFLDQAHAAAQAGHALEIHDGWVYFLHGWTQVIGEVFDVSIPTEGAAFDRLSDLAKEAR